MKQIITSILKSLGLFIGFLLFFILGTSFILIKGPSRVVSNLYVNSLKESSGGGFIADIFLTEQEVQEALDSNKIIISDDVTESSANFDNSNLDMDEIIIEKVTGSTFRGTMMIINDPSRVSVETIDTFCDTCGKPVQYIVDLNDGIGGINGGRFYDNGQGGVGGSPMEIVISNGEMIMGNTDTKYPMMGFNADDKLIVGNISGKEALEMGIRDALSFGPILITNGEPAKVVGDGSGLNPRTVIGQRADGAVLLLVIDGRQANSLGADFQDCIEVMLEYGAINAGNLDGGSSSTMVYQGETVSEPATLYGDRKVPTIFMVK